MDVLTTSQLLRWTKVAVVACLIARSPAFAAERHVPAEHAAAQTATDDSLVGDETAFSNDRDLASPLKVRAGTGAFGGAALRLQIDQQRLTHMRERQNFLLRDFMLAPGAAGEGARPVTLRLRAMNVFGPETRFVLGDPTGQGREIDLPTPDVALFEGSVADEPGSEVFLAFSAHGIYGFVNAGDSTQIISSGPARVDGKVVDEAMIYDPRALPPGAIHWRDFVCETVTPNGVPRPTPDEGGIAGANPPCRNVLLAIETDFEFTDDLFNGNLNAAASYVAVLTAAGSSRFNLAINARLRLGYVRLWNNPADPWTMTTANQQLLQFHDVWEATMESVPRHLAHFLSPRELGGGVAYMSVMCHPDWGYGFSGGLDGHFPFPIVNNHAQNWDIVVFCHELGHNFGTVHTHQFCPPVDLCASQAAWGDCQNSTVCSSNGTIMSYCHTCGNGQSNIVVAFHNVTAQAMLGHLDSISPSWCVLDCTPATLLVPQDYATIQAAIDASVDGDEVVLADGVHTGTGNKNLDFHGRSITVRSASGNPTTCIINCQNSGSAFVMNHGETTASVVNGVTISNGLPGVRISSAGATFTNCVFDDNHAGVDGGAGMRVEFGEVHINDCEFLDNAVTDPGGFGGAISLNSASTGVITNTLFEDNTAALGGAIIASGGGQGSLRATGCVFSGNWVSASGGAIYGSAPMTLDDCVFVGNTTLSTTGWGGAIVLPVNSSAVISNCAFLGNRAGTATGDGGAIYADDAEHLLVSNCVFSGNRAGPQAGGLGGGIYLNLVNHSRIANCTFAGNTAGAVGGIRVSNGSAIITNCILWGNSVPQVSHGGGAGSLQVTYCDLQQAGVAGIGNINLDPLFIDPIGPDTIVGSGDDDLRVAGNSPVIDAGTNFPHNFQRSAARWLALRPAAETATFDETYEGIVGGTGCLSGGTGPAVVTLDGGTMTVTALDSVGNPACAIVDGSTPAAVSDASLGSAGAKLRLQFDPPITAFHTFYGSLNTGTTGSLRLFHEGVQVGLFTSLTSPHATNATGHGVSALAPIDEIEVTVTDSNSVMGAFAAIWPSETSLGTTNIPGYGGPQGANVLNDFGVVFGDADLPGDLNDETRVADGDNDGSAIVDMGAYEFQVDPCPSDVNGDGAVNVSDLLAVIINWGATGASPADINGDGMVSVADLLMVITAWGACP